MHYGAGSGDVGPREADSEGEAKDRKTPGTAWCRGRCPTQGRSLWCHTVRRRREEGESPSPDQSAVDKKSSRPVRRPDRCRNNQISKRRQPRKTLRTTDQHHQTPGWGGQRGGRRRKHQTNQNSPGQTTGPDTEANQPGTGGKGEPTRQGGNQPLQRHHNNKAKTHRNQHKKQKGKDRERQRTKRGPPRKFSQGTAKLSFEWKGPDVFP